MIIQILLIIILFFVLLNFIRHRNNVKTKAYKSISFLIFLALSIIFIIEPNILNSIANFVGVGRGADLLLYILIVLFIYQSINDYFREKENRNKTVLIVRKLSILEAMKEKNGKKLNS